MHRIGKGRHSSGPARKSSGRAKLTGPRGPLEGRARTARSRTVFECLWLAITEVMYSPVAPREPFVTDNFELSKLGVFSAQPVI